MQYNYTIPVHILENTYIMQIIGGILLMSNNKLTIPSAPKLTRQRVYFISLIRFPKAMLKNHCVKKPRLQWHNEVYFWYYSA